MFNILGGIIKKHPYLNVLLKNNDIVSKTKEILKNLKFNPDSILVEFKNSKIYLKTDTPLIKNQLFYNKNKIQKFLKKDVIVN